MKKARVYKSKILQEFFKSITIEEIKKVESRMLLAAKIGDAMRAKNWKKKDLAQALNHNQSIITRWLSGTHNFTLDTLIDIECVLGIKLINLEEINNISTKKYQIISEQKHQKSQSLVSEPRHKYKSQSKGKQ